MKPLFSASHFFRTRFLFSFLLLQIPAVAHAQLTYSNINHTTITITGYKGNPGSIAIPATISGLPVTSIADDAFEYSTLTNVTIPSSVTNIGFSAFGLTGLTDVTIPDSVVSLNGSVFYECTNLTNASIPNGITNIGGGMFRNCVSLTNFAIPDSVRSFGEQAFAYTGLTTVVIPASVTNVGLQAFEYCANLSQVYFKGDAPAGSSMFEADSNVTVYYMPGTTGWTSTFQNAPAILWNPLIQTGDGSFGISNNQFGFNITGTTNIPLVVEASDDLENWTPLQTNTLISGKLYFSDAQRTNFSKRFYRISSP